MNPQFGQGFLHPHGLGRTSAPHFRQVGRRLEEAGRSREEGVGSALGTDRGFGSMA